MTNIPEKFRREKEREKESVQLRKSEISLRFPAIRTSIIFHLSIFSGLL